MSIEETKAQMFQASEMLTYASQVMNGAALAVEDATQLAQLAFEETGRADFLEQLGRLYQLGVDVSTPLIECLSISENLRNAAGTL